MIKLQLKRWDPEYLYKQFCTVWVPPGTYPLVTTLNYGHYFKIGFVRENIRCLFSSMHRKILISKNPRSEFSIINWKLIIKFVQSVPAYHNFSSVRCTTKFCTCYVREN